jgi:hypothetical protein
LREIFDKKKNADFGSVEMFWRWMGAFPIAHAMGIGAAPFGRIL